MVFPARAERGALTLEVASGATLGRTGAPEMSTEALLPLLVKGSGRLSIFFSPRHDLDLGLSLRGGSSRLRELRSVEVQGRLGTYVEQVSEGAIWALLRASGLGLVSRAFVELGLGARIERHTHREHLQPSGGEYVSFGLALPDLRVFAPAATLSVGYVWVGDRLSFGLRGGGDLARTPERFTTSVHLELFTAWSFYP